MLSLTNDLANNMTINSNSQSESTSQVLLEAWDSGSSNQVEAGWLTYCSNRLVRCSLILFDLWYIKSRKPSVSYNEVAY